MLDDVKYPVGKYIVRLYVVWALTLLPFHARQKGDGTG